MDDLEYKVQTVKLSDTVTFHCQRCAECCRHITNKIMLEPLDAYQIGRKLGLETTGDVFNRYTDPCLIAKFSPVFTLKAVGPEQSCIFLKDGRCSIYDARPHVCKMYPFSAEPLPGGKYHYVLCRDAEHHFTGGQVHVSQWMHTAFAPWGKETVWKEFVRSLEILRLFGQLSDDKKMEAIYPLLALNYVEIDVRRPYEPQREANHKRLVNELKKLRSGGV